LTAGTAIVMGVAVSLITLVLAVVRMSAFSIKGDVA
jgi:hypothetical protein